MWKVCILLPSGGRRENDTVVDYRVRQSTVPADNIISVCAPPVGVCRSLQRDSRPLPAYQHRKDHRPGSPGEDEPSADDAAVLRRTVVSDTRRVRPEVCLKKKKERHFLIYSHIFVLFKSALI